MAPATPSSACALLVYDSHAQQSQPSPKAVYIYSGIRLGPTFSLALALVRLDRVDDGAGGSQQGLRPGVLAAVRAKSELLIARLQKETNQ